MLKFPHTTELINGWMERFVYPFSQMTPEISYKPCCGLYVLCKNNTSGIGIKMTYFGSKIFPIWGVKTDRGFDLNILLDQTVSKNLT